MGNDMRVIFGHEQCCLPAQCPLELCAKCRFCGNQCVIHVVRQSNGVEVEGGGWERGAFNFHAEGQSLHLPQTYNELYFHVYL